MHGKSGTQTERRAARGAPAAQAGAEAEASDAPARAGDRSAGDLYFIAHSDPARLPQSP